MKTTKALLILPIILLIISGCSDRLAEVNKPFPTTPDTTSPSVTMTQPNIDEQDVSTLQPILVTFDEAMDESTITPENVLFYQLPTTGTIIPLEFKTDSFGYNNETQTLYFEAATELQFDQVYRVELQANPTTNQGIKDLEGNLLNNNLTNRFTWSFTTKQNLPLAIKAVRPRAGATDVETNSDIEIIIDPVYLTSDIDISLSTISLKSADGQLIDGNLIVNSDQNTVHLRTTRNLLLETSFSAEFSLSSTTTSNQISALWDFTSKTGEIDESKATAISSPGIKLSRGYNFPNDYPAYPETEQYQHVQDSLGNINVFWRQNDKNAGYQPAIWTNRYNTKSGWIQNELNGERISKFFSTDQIILDIKSAVDRYGNITLAWIVRDTTLKIDDLWATHFSNDRGWAKNSNGELTSVLLESDAVNSVNEFNIDVDHIGNVTIVFSQGKNLWAQHLDIITEKWSSQEQTEIADPLNIYTTHLYPRNLRTLINQKGDITLIWDTDQTERGRVTTGRNLSYGNIHSKKYSLANGWSAHRLIRMAADKSRDNDFTAAVIDSEGNISLLWTEYWTDPPNHTTQHYALLAAQYLEGIGWVRDAQNLVNVDILSNRGDAVRDLHLVFDNNGNNAAIWHQADQIFATRSSLATGWQTDVNGLVNIQALDHSDYPAIASIAVSDNQLGDTTAIWITKKIGDQFSQLRAARYDLNSGWLTNGTGNLSGTKITNTNMVYTTALPQLIRIEAENNGNIHLMWTEDNTNNNTLATRNLHYSKYIKLQNSWTAGSTENPSSLIIENNDLGDVNHYNFALDSRGNVFATWVQTDGTLLNLYANRYDSNKGSWWKDSTESISGRLIESDTANDIITSSEGSAWGYTLAPIPFADSLDKFTVIWRQKISQNSRAMLWANRFD